MQERERQELIVDMVIKSEGVPSAALLRFSPRVKHEVSDAQLTLIASAIVPILRLN